MGGPGLPILRHVNLRTRAKDAIAGPLDLLSYTSRAYVDLKSQAVQMASSLISFTAEPTTPADDALLGALVAFLPVAVPESEHERVGGDHDGGYVMLKAAAPPLALSFGVGPDVSWDADLGQRGTRSHMFDHTVRKLPQDVPNGTFHRLGVGPQADSQLRTLADCMALAGVDGGRAYLKMDVEGAEWPVLAAVQPDVLAGFEQIVMECHDLGTLRDPAAADQILAALENITAGHACIHIHANNYSRIIKFGSYWFPDTIEATFVRRDLLAVTAPPATIACEHDCPSDPRVEEIDLSGLVDPLLARRLGRN